MTMLFRPDDLDLETACQPATDEEKIRKLTAEVNRLRAELDRICGAMDRCSRERSELISELAGVHLAADLPGDTRGAELVRAITVLRYGHQEAIRIHEELGAFRDGVRACPTTIVATDGTKIPVTYNLQELAQKLTEILEPGGFPTTQEAEQAFRAMGWDPAQVRKEGGAFARLIASQIEKLSKAHGAPWTVPDPKETP